MLVADHATYMQIVRANGVECSFHGLFVYVDNKFHCVILFLHTHTAHVPPVYISGWLLANVMIHILHA